MRLSNSLTSTGKLAIVSVLSCFTISVFPGAAYGTRTSLPGGQAIELDGRLTGEAKNRFGEGWDKATFIGKNGQRLQLFSEERLTKNGGIVFEDFDQRNVSATGRFVVLPLVRQGTLESAGERPRVEGREYCPVIETATGCIVTMQTGAICGGEWNSKGDRWMESSTDRTSEMTRKTTSGANKLWSEFANSSVRLKLGDVILSNMGISNVMACDPPSGVNRKSYLAIAEQLKIEKASSQAQFVESKLAVTIVRSGKLEGARLIVSADRARLYDSPNTKAKTRMYLVRGDVVTVVDANTLGWAQVDYHEKNGHVLRRWIQTDYVESDDANESK